MGNTLSSALIEAMPWFPLVQYILCGALFSAFSAFAVKGAFRVEKQKPLKTELLSCLNYVCIAGLFLVCLKVSVERFDMQIVPAILAFYVLFCLGFSALKFHESKDVYVSLKRGFAYSVDVILEFLRYACFPGCLLLFYFDFFWISTPLSVLILSLVTFFSYLACYHYYKGSSSEDALELPFHYVLAFTAISVAIFSFTLIF